MREDDFDLGDLIWVDFEFEDDEKGTFHPAIVLQDQGDIIAVLSGTSQPTPEHLVVRNEMFTSFEVSPYCIEHENAKTIRHETYFQLEIVKGVKSDKIKSRIGRLNPDRLEELLARCAMRSWFSSDRTEQNDASRWDLICWVRNEHDSSTHIRLEDLNLGVVVGKLKNGKLRILRECEKREGSLNNLTFSSSELPTNDIGYLTLESKPATISSKQVCFVIDRLPKEPIRKIRELPYIKFSKDDKGELGKPKDSSLIGKIVCLVENKEKPLLVVGNDQNYFFGVEGHSKQKQSSSEQDFSCDLPGFGKIICFDLNADLIPKNIHKRRFVIHSLIGKDLDRLLSSNIVNALKSLN